MAGVACDPKSFWKMEIAKAGEPPVLVSSCIVDTGRMIDQMG